MLKSVLIGFAVLFALAFVLIFRPVPIVEEEDALIKKGIVTDIFEGSEKDIVFILKDCKTKFYINRGMERGLSIESLKKELINNEVVIKYPKYWTPLDWNGKIKHASKLEFRGKILFNELK
jgi:hypothetical protein